MEPKFKVGDIVIRKNKEHCGMKPGDRDKIVSVGEVLGNYSYNLVKYGPGHSERNLTSQSELNEQKMKRLLGVLDEEET